MTAPDRTLPDPDVEPTIGVERGAMIVGCGRQTAYNRVRAGDWPAIRLGPRRIVLPTARWLAAVGLLEP